jgi:hypothetical protein
MRTGSGFEPQRDRVREGCPCKSCGGRFSANFTMSSEFSLLRVEIFLIKGSIRAYLLCMERLPGLRVDFVKVGGPFLKFSRACLPAYGRTDRRDPTDATRAT